MLEQKNWWKVITGRKVLWENVSKLKDLSVQIETPKSQESEKKRKKRHMKAYYDHDTMNKEKNLQRENTGCI